MRSVRAAVLYEWSTPAEGRQHGIAIYWPSARRPPRPGADSGQWGDFSYYAGQLEFSRMTSWEDFLAGWGR